MPGSVSLIRDTSSFYHQHHPAVKSRSHLQLLPFSLLELSAKPMGVLFCSVLFYQNGDLLNAKYLVHLYFCAVQCFIFSTWMIGISFQTPHAQLRATNFPPKTCSTHYCLHLNLWQLHSSRYLGQESPSRPWPLSCTSYGLYSQGVADTQPLLTTCTTTSLLPAPGLSWMMSLLLFCRPSQLIFSRAPWMIS